MMEHIANETLINQSGFACPSVPHYDHTYSTFDANNTDCGFYAPTLERDRALERSTFSGYSQQVAATCAAKTCQVSYPSHGFEFPAFGQNASDLSPASFSGHGPDASFLINHGLSNNNAANSIIASDSTEAVRKKRPRGTTGKIVCDRCGTKFTVMSSRNRHNKICRGNKSAKKPSSTPMKVTKTKSSSVLVKSEYNINALPLDETKPSTPEEQYQNVVLNQNFHVKSVTSTIANSLETANAALISNSPIPNTWPHKPATTQNYVLKDPDICGDHTIFYCDLCPEFFDRRGLLQTHKTHIHGLVEIPYLPDSGIIDRPWYLGGVTSKTGGNYSHEAVQIYERGPLSSSPCQPYEPNGFDCVVSPSLSSKCSHCNHRNNGIYCGAAGVGYS